MLGRDVTQGWFNSDGRGKKGTEEGVGQEPRWQQPVEHPWDRHPQLKPVPHPPHPPPHYYQELASKAGLIINDLSLIRLFWPARASPGILGTEMSGSSRHWQESPPLAQVAWK